MTFSIVAVDRQAEEVGFAIASCNWDARRVCMARAETGAIASQGSGNQDLLPRFFEKLGAGQEPGAILDGFRASDEGIEKRQVGLISFDGTGAAHTGAACMPWAGHRIGDGYTCQGNILAGPQVVDAMAEAFEQTQAPLYARLYAALSAGEHAGGDLRGRQSAGLVIKKTGQGQPGTDTYVDFTIEDHQNPIAELGRIMQVAGSLVAVSMMQEAFRGAVGAARGEVLNRLRGFLEDKKDPRYLDAWMFLAKAFHEIDDTHGAADALAEHLSICPAMRGVLRHQAAEGHLPSAWDGLLKTV